MLLNLLTTVGSAATEAEAATLGDWLLPFFIIAILIVLNGIYVASEFSIIGTRPTQMEELAGQGNSTAQHILETLNDAQRQDRYIATAQLGITIASLGLGMYAEPALEHLLEPYLRSWFDLEAWATRFGSTPEDILHFLGYVLVLSVITYLHVVVGEMIPKSLALSSSARTALWLDPLMRVSQLVLTPLVRLLNAIGNVILRALRLPPATTRVHSPEEIEQIISESAEGGFINEDEREIIQNIFDFGDRTVGQVMTPRRKVQAVPVDIPRDALMKMVAESTHNRFPIYEGDRDHIIGILHMQNLIKHQLQSKGHQFDLRLLLNTAPAVPEDKPVEELLAIFKRRHIHMAIVLDEFGGMAGVVTLEDLVEEIVGEVQDEFDNEKPPLIEVQPGVLDVAGNYLLDDLDNYIYLGDTSNLPDVDTVGGLVVTALGRPPEVGNEVKHNESVHFVVQAVDGRAISRVLIHYPVAEKSDL